jgi:hypothetical protein
MTEGLAYLQQTGATKVGEGRGRLRVVPIGDIVYGFRGSVVSQNLIRARWTREISLRPKALYFRSYEGEVFCTGYRSFPDFAQSLNPRFFVRLNRAVLVNLRRIENLDFEGKKKFVDVRLQGGIESLETSRRAALEVRARLGLFPRKKRKVGSA